MFNISFMNGYLKNKVSKKVTINIFGILEFDLSISKFEKIISYSYKRCYKMKTALFIIIIK